MKPILNHILASYRGFALRIWIVIFATFVDSMGTSIGIFLALYLSIIIKMPIEHVGLIVSAFGVGAFVGSYLGGFLCDKFDCHKVSIVMLLSSGTLTALISSVKQFFPLLILVVSSGLFYGAFKPANTLNLLKDIDSTDRARVNGLYRVAANLGLGAASLIGGLIVSIHFAAVFWFDALTSWIAAIVLFCFYQPSVLTTEKAKITSQSLPIKLYNKEVLCLCFLLLINCIVFFQVRTTYPLFLNKQYNIDASIYGSIFLLNCMMVVLLEVPLLNAVKHINQRLIAGVGAFLICCGMFILPFGHSILFAVLSCVILTLGEILLFSTMMILILDCADESSKGKYIGAYQSMFALASMFAPVLGGYIYAKEPDLVWYFCGLVGLLSVVIFMKLNLSSNRMATITENA